MLLTNSTRALIVLTILEVFTVLAGLTIIFSFTGGHSITKTVYTKQCKHCQEQEKGINFFIPSVFRRYNS
jgi:hypothetical protein